MKYFTMIFTSLAVAIIVPLIFKILVKKVEVKEEFQSHFEINIKWFRVLSVVLFVVTSVLTILINIFVGLEIWVNIILALCIISCALFVVAGRFNVLVSDGEIVYTPCFSKTKRFHMKHISLIKIQQGPYGMEEYIIYVFDKKVLRLSNVMKNVGEFINMARAYDIKIETIEFKNED